MTDLPWDNVRLDREQAARSRAGFAHARSRGRSVVMEDFEPEALRARVRAEHARRNAHQESLDETDPIILNEWPRGTKGKDRFRISLDYFHGRLMLDFREWTRGKQGALFPTTKGIKIGADSGRIREIIETLEKAEAQLKTSERSRQTNA